MSGMITEVALEKDGKMLGKARVNFRQKYLNNYQTISCLLSKKCSPKPPQNAIDSNTSKKDDGFRSGFSTAEHTHYNPHKGDLEKPLCLIFTDYEKTFDLNVARIRSLS